MMQQQQAEDFTGLHSYLASDHQQNGTGANVGIYGYNYHQLYPASFLNNSYEVGGGGSYNSTPSTTPLYGGRYQQQQPPHPHGMMTMEIGGDIGGSNYNNSNNSSSNNYKAMMALRNHKEAEKRRRERINSHLDRLRALLPCNSKTDKATLLAKVVQRVGELNQQTSHLINLDNTMPTSTDSYSVYTLNDQDEDFHGGGTQAMTKRGNKKFILKASLCCEDRADLFSDLIETLDSLNLKTLRAEISTLGGRVRNVLIVSRTSTGGNHEEDGCGSEEEDDDGCGSKEDDDDEEEECIGFLHEALKGIVERSSSSNANERVKRRRRLIVDPTTTSC